MLYFTPEIREVGERNNVYFYKDEKIDWENLN